MIMPRRECAWREQPNDILTFWPFSQELWEKPDSKKFCDAMQNLCWARRDERRRCPVILTWSRQPWCCNYFILSRQPTKRVPRGRRRPFWPLPSCTIAKGVGHFGPSPPVKLDRAVMDGIGVGVGSDQCRTCSFRW